MLRLVNSGVTISRDTLLLGTTTKYGKDLRGQFGEGFKLAWLVLLRAGLKVWCKSGDERWVPEIAHSNAYDAELLMVKTAPVKYENQVLTDVIGLSEKDWETIQERCLFLVKPKAEDVIDLGKDRVLLGEKYRGQLYVRGLWVCKLPGSYYWGYDLHSVKLDRDRRIADPWDLQYALRKVLGEAAQKIKRETLWEVLNGEWAESRVVADMTFHQDDLNKQMAAAFVETHGKEAVPVDDTPASVEAKHHGFKGVVVSKALKVVIEKEIGTFETKKKDRAMDAKTRFSADDLTEEETKNLTWGVDLVKNVVKTPFTVQVVEFYGPKVLGTFVPSTGGSLSVNIARRILTDRKEVIVTLVHELAHEKGGDGTVEHRDEIDRLFGAIVVLLAEVVGG